jgi:hypothetical protein
MNIFFTKLIIGGDKMKENETKGARNAHGRDEKWVQHFAWRAWME